MRRHISIFVSLLFIISFTIQAQDDYTLDYDEYERTYQIYVPETVLDTPPLLIVLHGGGGDSGGIMLTTGFNDLADEEGFVVLYPNGIENFWNNGVDVAERRTIRENVDDVGFIMALIDEVAQTILIDRERVFVTGFSNGGMMTFRLACEATDQFAGIATVVANMPLPYADSCAPNAPLSVLMINGTDDPLLPYEGGERYLDGQYLGTTLSVNQQFTLWAENNGCTGVPQFSVLPPSNLADRTRAHLLHYTNCEEDSVVQLYTLVGGGHTWAGAEAFFFAEYLGTHSNTINATQVIWEFFANIE